MTNENETFCLSAEDDQYIIELLTRNQNVIRAVIRSVLVEDYARLGEDCISELSLLVCIKLSEIKNHEKPDAWIALAARRIAQNASRKQSTISRRTSDVEVEDVGMDDNIFENALYNIWMQDGSIDKLLNTLTPHERKIYELIYKERLNSKEAAKLMNVSDSTIRNTTAAIRRKIKNAIETELF